MHTIYSKGLKSVMIKIDLSKAYDRVSWLYLHLLLIHLGFSLLLVRWITRCVMSTYFEFLLMAQLCPFSRKQEASFKVVHYLVYFPLNR